MQIRKAIGWSPEKFQAPQTASSTAAHDQLLMQLLSHRPVEYKQLEAPVMPPSCLRPAAGSSATALMQQCLAGVELPGASAIAMPQLTSTFDCCAEAQPLAAAAHAGDAAAEQAALTTWVCSEPADVWRRCTAAHTAVLEAPCFMPLAIATAAPRMHDIRTAMSAADAEVAQLLGDISLQVWLLHCAGHINIKCCKICFRTLSRPITTFHN